MLAVSGTKRLVQFLRNLNNWRRAFARQKVDVVSGGLPIALEKESSIAIDYAELKQALTDLRAVEASKGNSDFGLVSLHSHLEGSLNFNDLQTIAQKIGVGFLPVTWAEIERRMSFNGERNLSAFIARLSTRWLQLIMLKALQEGKQAEAVLQAITDFYYQKLSAMGITQAEPLVSMLNLVQGGDLSGKIERSDFLPEEKEIYEWWGASAKNGLASLEQYADCMQISAQEYAIGGGVCLSLRRNASPEKRELLDNLAMLTTDVQPTEAVSSQTQPESGDSRPIAYAILHLIKLGKLKRIDFCGVESGYPAIDFENFCSWLLENKNSLGKDLAKLTDQQLFFALITVHAGEIDHANGNKVPHPQITDDWPEAALNLWWVIKKGVGRIGHGTRLFGIDLLYPNLLQEFMRGKSYIEFSLESNRWTGVTDANNVYKHPIIRTIRGEHPLVANGTINVKDLWQRIIIVDDDLAVYLPYEGETYSLLSAYHQVLELVIPYVYPEHLTAIKHGSRQERAKAYQAILKAEIEKTKQATNG